MGDIPVGEGLFSRIVLFVECREPVPLELFKAAVLEHCGRVRDKASHSILCDKQGVLYQHALGQVLVVTQNGSAVAGVESRRDDLKAELIGDGFDLAQTLQILGGTEADAVHTRQNNRRQPMFRCGFGNFTDFLHVLVGIERAANIDPTVGVDLLLIRSVRTPVRIST